MSVCLEYSNGLGGVTHIDLLTHTHSNYLFGSMYRFSSSFFLVYYLKHKNLDFTCYRKNGKELFFFKQYFSYKFIFFTIWLVFFSFFIFLSKKIKKKKTFENSGGSWLIVFPFLSSLYIIIHYLVSCDLICGAMFLVSQSLL